MRVIAFDIIVNIFFMLQLESTSLAIPLFKILLKEIKNFFGKWRNENTRIKMNYNL